MIPDIIQPDWPAPASIKAYTTTRQSWQGQQTSAADTAELVALLKLPSNPCWLMQKHTAIVKTANHENLFAVGDASITHTPDNVCAIITADCLPILLTDSEGSQVAAIHAGWRGLASGIIAATIATMHKKHQILAWLGPAISQKKFEVGRDVYDAFVNPQPSLTKYFLKTGNEKWHANLYGIARELLSDQHIDAVYGGQYCTHTQSELFFSFRRERATGRMVSLIWIDSNCG